MSLHPHLDHKCDHEENRMKVCAPCGRKIVFQNKPSNNFLLSEKQVALIKNHINDQFDVSNEKFPKSICISCRLTINEVEKHGSSKRPLPSMPNYEDIKLVKTTRQITSCECYICLTAQSTNHKKNKKGRGLIRQVDIKIDVNKGPENTLQAASTKTNKNKERTSLEICKSCFQEVGKGIPHYCKGASSSSARGNVFNFVEKLPDKQQNQIITSLLKRKIEANTNDTDELLLNNTAGKKTRISVNKKEESEIIFSAESLSNFQATTASSTNYMKKMVNFIRSKAGRKSVPSNYNQNVQEKQKMMENIYQEHICQFETNEGIKERPVIYANASELLDFVFEQRNLKKIQEVKIKVMADGGQNFFKISISVLSQEEEDEEQNDSGKKNVSFYSSDGNIGNKRKLNSVYRLIILCIVPNIKETYGNLKTLIDLTKLNDIPFKFASDFKLILIFNGQQTATATYPCPYCFVTLKELQSFDQITDESSLEIDKQMPNTNLKTYKHLKDDYFQFNLLHCDKKKAKECHSTIHFPLFVEENNDEDDDVYVLEKCVPPELHLLQGFVNHLFWNGIVKVVGGEKALLWPKNLSIVHKNYQGEVFEGNQCRKLLKEADKLQDLEIYEAVGQYRLQPFIASFKAMNKIVESCFSTKQVDLCNFDKNISELRNALKSTDVSQTVKIHVILDHLKEAIILLKYDGLGVWSEQAGESIHREFVKFWERFKINLIEDQSYSQRLKKAAATFSSQHI